MAEKDYYDVFKTEMLGQLKRLGTDYIDAYLLHSARYVYDDAILNALSKLKKEGYAKLVGVSVYEPDEAIKGIEKDTVDFLQLPFSIFDQRMRNAGVFEIAKKGKNTIIDSRSAFVQGLILMNEEQVPDYLADAKPIVKKIDALCKEHRISRTALALNYVKSQEEISSLVFGVDNLEQLKENIDSFNMNVDYDLMRDISKEFENVKAEIVMPSLWVKH